MEKEMLSCEVNSKSYQSPKCVPEAKFLRIKPQMTMTRFICIKTQDV